MSLPTMPAPPVVEYPESDGMPMAENTRQYELIVYIRENLSDIFRGQPVVVAADNFIYPVEGRPGIVYAPDVYVAFGRPPGHRASYKVWEEGGVFPQVIFEFVSPSNTVTEMLRKFNFYSRYGAEEYYIYDPDHQELNGYRRVGGRLEEIGGMSGWVSPRLGVRFGVPDGELVLYRPDGQRFRSFIEVSEALRQERDRADTEKARADALAAKLRALGLDPDAP